MSETWKDKLHLITECDFCHKNWANHIPNLLLQLFSKNWFGITYHRHTVYFWREILIKKYPFRYTSIWTSIMKRLWKAKKLFTRKVILQRYFVIYKRAPLKMQEIMKYLCSMTFTVNIFLAFHNLFMMLVHMEVYLKGYFLSSISLQKYTVWYMSQLKSS